MVSCARRARGGLKHLRVGDNFDSEGGTELAPMSATADLAVAARYAVSPFSLVFKIVAKSFMERGVDLSYLSCFPERRSTTSTCLRR